MRRQSTAWRQDNTRATNGFAVSCKVCGALILEYERDVYRIVNCKIVALFSVIFSVESLLHLKISSVLFQSVTSFTDAYTFVLYFISLLKKHFSNMHHLSERGGKDR